MPNIPFPNDLHADMPTQSARQENHDGGCHANTEHNDVCHSLIDVPPSALFEAHMLPLDFRVILVQQVFNGYTKAGCHLATKVPQQVCQVCLMPNEAAMQMGKVLILVLAAKHWWRWCSMWHWWQATVSALVGGEIKPHLQNYILGFFDTIAMQIAISSSCS